MQFDLVQCTIRLMQKGNRDLTTIVKAGPDAITPAELVLHRMVHDLPGFDEDGCAIGDAVVVGSVEMTKGELYDALMRKGFKPAMIDAAFPAGRGIPQTLAQADLPHTSFGKPQRKVEEPKVETTKARNIKLLGATPAARKVELMNVLNKAGVPIPKGNLSEADLMAIAEENNVALTEEA